MFLILHSLYSMHRYGILNRIRFIKIARDMSSGCVSRCPRRRGDAWPACPAPPASGSPCPRPAPPAAPSLPTGGTRTGPGSWPMGAGYPGHVTRYPPITAHLSSHLTSTQPGEETRAWLGPRYHVSRAVRAEQRHSHLQTLLNIYTSIYSYRYICL